MVMQFDQFAVPSSRAFNRFPTKFHANFRVPHMSLCTYRNFSEKPNPAGEFIPIYAPPIRTIADRSSAWKLIIGRIQYCVH